MSTRYDVKHGHANALFTIILTGVRCFSAGHPAIVNKAENRPINSTKYSIRCRTVYTRSRRDSSSKLYSITTHHKCLFDRCVFVGFRAIIVSAFSC